MFIMHNNNEAKLCSTYVKVMLQY